MRDSRPLLAGCLLATSWLATGCGGAPEAAAPAAKPELPVLQAAVLNVAASPWPEVVKTQGSLIADEIAVVGAKVAGRVSEVNVDLGDVIVAGAPLAQLDQAEFQLNITLAEAQRTQARAALGLSPSDPVSQLKPENAPPVREAKAVWDEVRARIQRLQPLAERNAVTRDELELAISEEGVAAARYSAAINGVREKIALIGVREAELAVAQQALADTLVIAPFEGMIRQRHVTRGSYVQVGQPIVTLVRTSTLRFQGTVPERHAYRLSIGQQVVLRIEAIREPRTAKITRISPGVDVMNRSLVFEAEIENSGGALRAGMFAEAEVVIDPEAMALAIPRSAVSEFAGVEKVWLVEGGVSKEVPIETARRTAEAVEVVGGLELGAQILGDASSGKVARIEPVSTLSSAEVLLAARRNETSAPRAPGALDGSEGDDASYGDSESEAIRSGE
jgi:RND family efflux transporter MFP subunit